jgi:class 3 adenylate cyclase
MRGRGYRFVGPIVIEAECGVTEVPPRVDTGWDAELVQHGAAELRQIVAMSCELVALAARADGLGFEDRHEVVRAFRCCVSEIVGHYNGFIARNLGNTVLILFGCPAAHEHDAKQAVRAALELCATLRTGRPIAGVPMRCRVGITTGMAIIGDLIQGAVRSRIPRFSAMF